MYILISKDKKVLVAEKKQSNATYHSPYQVEEFETEEEMIARAKEIQEDWKPKEKTAGFATTIHK